jgi:(1->4)-alpha-D-glucan 1-alpha-D-glucosylmutase
LRARRGEIGASAPPDWNDEYLFYQLLVGSWEGEFTASYIERLKGAMTKSLREAKVHTNWQSPNREYEDAVLSFVDDVADTENSQAFLSSFLPFQEKVARLGVQNSLVQLTLKLTSPGIPDLYQGSELWDLSMVDPDNRRPVDYERRNRLLDELDPGASLRGLWRDWKSGAIKMFVTRKLLRFRAENASLFACGKYESVIAEGAGSDCICGFERHHEDRSVVVLTARFPVRREVEPGWGDTKIPLPERLRGQQLREVFTRREIHSDGSFIDAGEVFGDLPIAVIERGQGGELPY